MIATSRTSLVWLCLPAFTLACQSAPGDFSSIDSDAAFSSERGNVGMPGGPATAHEGRDHDTDLDDTDVDNGGDGAGVDGDGATDDGGSAGDGPTAYDCRVVVGLERVDRNRTAAQSKSSEFCNAAEDERTKYRSGGAYAHAMAYGGMADGLAATCESDVDGTSSTTMLAGLEVLQMKGDCPSIDELELEVPVQVFGIIASEASVDVTAKRSQSDDAWETVTFENSAYANISISGTDLGTAESDLSLLISTECEESGSEDNGETITSWTMPREASHQVCGPDAIDSDLMDRLKARSEGQVVLTMNEGDSDTTELVATTDYSAAATSATCEVYDSDSNCIQVTSAAQIETRDFCLEASAQNECTVLNDIPGITCKVDLRNDTVTEGDCG